MKPSEEDPLVRSSRREALFVIGMWFAAMLYTLIYCSLQGYGRPPESLELILGFPDWIFWGIIAPWSLCAAASIVFAVFFMKDDPLGEAAEEWKPDGSQGASISQESEVPRG